MLGEATPTLTRENAQLQGLKGILHSWCFSTNTRPLFLGPGPLPGPGSGPGWPDTTCCGVLGTLGEPWPRRVVPVLNIPACPVHGTDKAQKQPYAEVRYNKTPGAEKCAFSKVCESVLQLELGPTVSQAGALTPRSSGRGGIRRWVFKEGMKVK